MVEIQLTNSPLVALVDAADEMLVKTVTWRLIHMPNSPISYVGKNEMGRALPLTRFILSVGANQDVRHKNGNYLDHTRANLELIPISSQLPGTVGRHNKHGYRGVCEVQGKYRAAIRVGGRNNHLGTFKTPMDAALKYDEAASKAFGDKAILNFPRLPDDKQDEPPTSPDSGSNV